MTTIAAFISDIPATWKAVTALASAVALGVAVGVFLVGFTGLPEDVARNTEYRERHTREFAALVCLMTLPPETSRERAIRECGI